MQVSNLSLDPANFEATVKIADIAYHALQAPVTRVAAVQGAGAAVAAVTATSEVAAVKKSAPAKSSAGAGKKGQAKPRKRRDPADPATWGKPHADGPPPQACMHHHVYGRNAYFCSKPESCPWKHLSKPPKFD